MQGKRVVGDDRAEPCSWLMKVTLTGTFKNHHHHHNNIVHHCDHHHTYSQLESQAPRFVFEKKKPRQSALHQASRGTPNPDPVPCMSRYPATTNPSRPPSQASSRQPEALITSTRNTCTPFPPPKTPNPVMSPSRSFPHAHFLQFSLHVPARLAIHFTATIVQFMDVRRNENKVELQG